MQGLPQVCGWFCAAQPIWRVLTTGTQRAGGNSQGAGQAETQLQMWLTRTRCRICPGPSPASECPRWHRQCLSPPASRAEAHNSVIIRHHVGTGHQDMSLDPSRLRVTRKLQRWAQKQTCVWSLRLSPHFSISESVAAGRSACATDPCGLLQHVLAAADVPMVGEVSEVRKRVPTVSTA